MSVTTVIGAKHSPGASTLAIILAALSANERPTLLVEADPAGGDLAARAGLAQDPGLLTLAAAGRRGLTCSHLEAHAQRLGNGARVLVAPCTPVHAHAAVAGLARPLGSVLTEYTGACIVDAGRWDGQSAATEVVRAGASVVIVFRPTVEGVEHARARLASLASNDPVVAVMVGQRPYAAAEVRAVLGADELYVLEDDPRAAAALAAGAAIDRWLRRSPLVRSAAPLAERLAGPDRTCVAS
jgi:MinD-like ATPase involved in chromosome partitioning or flagellar assembly